MSIALKFSHLLLPPLPPIPKVLYYSKKTEKYRVKVLERFHLCGPSLGFCPLTQNLIHNHLPFTLGAKGLGRAFILSFSRIVF